MTHASNTEVTSPIHRSIIAIGEVLWDLFPEGPQFGGAPANFACMASQLNPFVEVALLSQVGQDELGDKAITELRERGVLTHLTMRSKLPTGTVNISLNSKGHPSYSIRQPAAWDDLEQIPSWTAAANQARLIYFGTLAQRTPENIKTIQAIIKAAPLDCLRLCDINLRPPFHDIDVIKNCLSMANILKLSDEELPVISKGLGLPFNPDRPTETINKIMSIHQIEMIAYTRGSKGALIIGEDKSDHTPEAINVLNTVGAGDAYTAMLATGLLHQWPIDIINRKACQVAAFVCEKPSATPTLPRPVLETLLSP